MGYWWGPVERGAWMPTIRAVDGAPYDPKEEAMGLVEVALRDAAPAWLSSNQVVKAVAARGRSMRNERIRQGAEDLAAAGRCEVANGPRNSRLFRVPAR